MSKIIEQEYTLQEFVDLKNKTPENSENANRWTSKIQYYPQTSKTPLEWFGGLKTWQEAQDLFNNGWSEGVLKLEQVKNEIKDFPAPINRLRRRVYSDDGDNLRLDQALNGDWDQAWESRKRKAGTGPAVIDLMVNFGGNCSQNAEEMFYQGAAAVIACDMLESAGYQVGIIGCPVNQVGSTIALQQVQIKQPQDPLQIGNLAAMICHAGVFRTMGFRLLLDTSIDVGYGLGYMTSFQNAQNNGWQKPDNMFLVEASNTKETVIEEVKRLINSVENFNQDLLKAG